MNETIANAIADSSAREAAIWLLRTVPGLPPISQAIHILGVAAVMGSAVMIDLKLLGVALPRQRLDEMVRRLMPWTFWALAVNVLTGLPFVLARPHRYFLNPVFGWKMAFLAPAVVLAVVVWAMNRRENGFWSLTSARRWTGRVLAAASLVGWIGVVMAGRWIAYSDYLFWPE
ncbi:MAG: DUF6644 family protein [Thermoanaerobaculia bacterium]|nr:DUF6644 family protein [Thermoanaerobaculia bacterium]